MSKKKRLIGLLCPAVLCSQGVCTQTREMGIKELLRLTKEYLSNGNGSRLRWRDGMQAGKIQCGIQNKVLL